MAKYCHNSCSKCPPFARTHARRRSCHSSTALSMMVCQCHAKHSEKAASVHNTYLDKIVCYLQRTFNGNRKLKQEVSKQPKCIKIGCVLKNQCTLHFRLHFFPDMPKLEPNF